jgi:Lon protease-like protein
MSLDSQRDSVCIFPLPEVALFPHALLPLHVFEPRYREMVRDCLAGDRKMAVAALEPGYEANYHGRPPVRPVCGLGELVAHDGLPDGRSNILLRGTRRVRILEELPPDHEYRVVRYAPLDDTYRDELDRARAVRDLVMLADQIALKLPSGADTLRQLVRSEVEVGALTDVLASALITEPAERQLLLETVEVAARVERVSAEMAAILLRFTESRGPSN